MRMTFFYCAVFSLLAVTSVGKAAHDQGSVQGVVSDVSDARIVNAKLAFRSGSDEYVTQTQPDGTYSIALKAGTYSVMVSSRNFCTFRRAAFILPKRSTFHFNFQMWVCPTDVEFIRYVELDEVPKTHLKPLVLYAQNELGHHLQRFYGPATDDDGTGHVRKYPAILTFNLLTVQSDEIAYDASEHLVMARGNVVWDDESKSGKGNSVQIKLDGFNPQPLSPD